MPNIKLSFFTSIRKIYITVYLILYMENDIESLIVEVFLSNPSSIFTPKDFVRLLENENSYKSYSHKDISIIFWNLRKSNFLESVKRGFYKLELYHIFSYLYKKNRYINFWKNQI